MIFTFVLTFFRVDYEISTQMFCKSLYSGSDSIFGMNEQEAIVVLNTLFQISNYRRLYIEKSWSPHTSILTFSPIKDTVVTSFFPIILFCQYLYPLLSTPHHTAYFLYKKC